MAASLLLLLLPLASPLSPIHVHDGHFVDEWGRVRLFHGINSVIKREPWYDEKMRDPARHRYRLSKQIVYQARESNKYSFV